MYSISRVRTLTFSVLTATMLGFFANAQEIKPEWTVFRLIEEDQPDITQGSAVMVHAGKGILLTAKHVVMHPEAVRIVIDNTPLNSK